MSTRIQVQASAATVPGDILVSRPPTGVRMRQSLLNGFYLQDLLIEPASGRVSGPGVEAHLKPKAVEVLLYLAERPFELVERDELLKAVWGDNAGSSDALTHVISDLRSCCQDHANSPSLIQTVPRRGYRLLQQPRLVDEPEPASETGVFQAPDDGSFIGKLMRRGVVQAGAAYLVFSWLLIQVADIVTPTLNLPAWVPTVVTVAAIGGFPIVLVLAWMLEQKDGRWFLDRGRQSGKMLSGLERNYLSILVAYGVAATGALAYQLTVGFDVPGGPEVTVAEADELLPVNPNSIAVLKFLNIGGNETGEIFSQGLGEDILDRLARVPGLAVSSRGDSWSLPQNASSDIVRNRLRVAYFLEGSVRVIGDELRVVVQLIESATGFHIFSRSFDTELEDHMGVQKEITSLTVANLRVALPEGVEFESTSFDKDPDLDAYVFFRRGRSILADVPTVDTLAAAVDSFNQAIDIDTEYSAAYAGTCMAYVDLYELTKDDVGIEKAEEACAAALISNPNLDIVYAALGRLRLNTGDMRDAEAAFRQALEINPKNVTAVRGIASILESRLKLDEAERMLTRAIDLQPGNWENIDALGGLYYFSGRYAEAANAYRKVVFLDPDNWIGLGNLGSSLMMTGDFESAVEPLTKSLSIEKDVYFQSALGTIYYYLGEFDRSVEALREATNLLPKANFAWLNLGDALRFSSQPELANDAYRRAIAESVDLLETNPQSAFDLYVQSWATASLGDEVKARSLIDRAAELAPNDPNVSYYSGLLYYVTGDTVAALEALELAIDAGYPVGLLSADPLLGKLQGDKRFEKLVRDR
jgi:tetratricopeptide (TPR) repeat protein/TolB-like protein/DNA-binding winged helix-turn-helix (wHTH) protein